jgi:TetR/AcrR family transcriptional regulator of autoinduction and epiphytic fitness
MTHRAVTARASRHDERSNRDRILTAAIETYARDPEASIGDIAKAAGVVRRTVYGYFENRRALIMGIADQVAADLATSVPDVADLPEDPALALAVFTLMTWPVGNRYRVLLEVARKELGEQRILELIEPARQPSLAITEDGQARGVFSSYLPASSLVALSDAATMTIIEEANKGVIANPGQALATISLVQAGIDLPRSTEIVARAVELVARQHLLGNDATNPAG